MQELTIKMPKGDVSITLNEPNFDQYRGAMLAMETPGGKNDRLAGGNFILTACIINEDRDKLDVIKADVKAHASAALEASDLLTVYNVELKKK